MLLLQLPKHEAPLKWPMYLSPNFDTCLVCSLTAPDVVSGNCDIYRSVFISEVSAVMWQSGNNPHTLMSTTSRPVPKKPLSNGHIWLREKEKTCHCRTWNIHLFSYLNSFMDGKQSSASQIFSEWRITLMCWCSYNTFFSGFSLVLSVCALTFVGTI